MPRRFPLSFIIVLLLASELLCPASGAEVSPPAPITPGNPNSIRLRAAWGVPDSIGGNAANLASLKILDAFMQRFPNIHPVSSAGLDIPGKTMDIVPLMQIAGDIPPDVMYVNFRQSA